MSDTTVKNGVVDSSRWVSATELAEQIRTGERSAPEVVDEAIARVETVDVHYCAVVAPLFDRARQRALTVDPSAPFAGVPILLKDAGEELADTSMWVGTQGLKRAGHTSRTTTVLAGRLEELGFIVIGKSACPELSASSTTEPPGFPPTRNPWDLRRSAGGSSGGSAAAVAGGLVPIAHGSDGSGSLRFPAALCGVSALKPSRGRVTAAPAAGSQDPSNLWTQFAVARDVRDLQALFHHLAVDQRRSKPATSILRCGVLDFDPIIGLSVDPATVLAVRSVAGFLEADGHSVEESYPPAFDDLFEPFWQTTQTIGPWVRASQVAWVAERLGRPVVDGDLSASVLEQAERGRSMREIEITQALERVANAMAPVQDWWNDHDILITPVTLEPAWTLGQDPAIKTGMFAAPFSFTGQPAIVIPAGWTDDGRPVGVQLVGRHGDDELLLHLAGQLQQQTKAHHQHPPQPA
jgi:amidase